MTAEDVSTLRELVASASGVVIDDARKSFVERRLRPRLEALGLTDFSAYCRYVDSGPDGREELEAAVELVTPGETYFFRQPLQLRALSRAILPAVHRRNEEWRKLRVWSAGCSTGEEPYTLSMLIHDAELFSGWAIELHGTDVSRRALATAEIGEYGPSSLRATPDGQRTRHFETAQGRFRVKPHVRRPVRFTRLNLLDRAGCEWLGPMDIILCRNVLMYLDAAARDRVLASFYDLLAPGGYLLLGHAEMLRAASSPFLPVSLEDDLVYRRLP